MEHAHTRLWHRLSARGHPQLETAQIPNGATGAK